VVAAPHRGLRRWAARGALAAVGATAIFVAYEIATWPDVAGLARRPPETTAFIERTRARGTDIRWHWVAYDDISDELKRAVVVAEDISFFSHRGFDTAEMRVAAREAITRKRLRGASTITQQLAKNLWLAPTRSPLRKLREAVLTWQLERHLDKRRLLELYLNVVELGPGIYGAGAASTHYYGIPPSKLDDLQAAELAASLPRPSQWHPGSPSPAYARYVREVLGRMEGAGWLDRRL
jgi:monofunctional biosynthetic peptidoglycan transglycosylase